jgi:hypothetical protein
MQHYLRRQNKLAEEAYSSSTFSAQVPMIPGVSAQLLIDGKTIVSKQRVIARDIRRTACSNNTNPDVE